MRTWRKKQFFTIVIFIQQTLSKYVSTNFSLMLVQMNDVSFAFLKKGVSPPLSNNAYYLHYCNKIDKNYRLNTCILPLK